MNRTKIEGVVNADGSQGYAWNPFVGCLNGCPYCWARKCLARSKCELCRKFAPHWHAERMEQPYTLKKPSTIAVCWMGDMWRYSALAKVLNENGSKWGLLRKKPSTIEVCWMGDVWRYSALAKVLNENGSKWELLRSGLVGIMGELKQHTFLCLTRQPISYLCFCTTPPHAMDFSKNVWLGVTVTCQEDVDRIGPDFAGIDHPNKFVSYEPMLGEIRDWGLMGPFGWLYMGNLTDGRGKVLQAYPNWWIEDAIKAGRKAGAKVWTKDSILDPRVRVKETPWLSR